MVRPVSGISLVTPADDDEDLQEKTGREAGREQLAERVAQHQRRAQPA